MFNTVNRHLALAAEEFTKSFKLMREQLDDVIDVIAELDKRIEKLERMIENA